MPGIGIGISPSLRRGGGQSWSSYWTKQFRPAIRQQYYWWDNAIYTGGTRRIHILHDIDGVKGIDYLVSVNSDASYEIEDIYLVDLECKKNGAINPTSYVFLYGIGQRMDTVTFTGTKITQKVSINTGSGIYKAVLLPGIKTFRGGAHTSLITSINAEKQKWENDDI